MSRRDWLLLLLAYKGAPDGLDPVRIQKSMFLLRHEPGGELPPDEAYEFVPYNYGPMSKEIYSDLDVLVDAGLAKKAPVEGQSWSLFRSTPQGLTEAATIVGHMTSRDTPIARKLCDVKQLVAEKTLNELVEYFYDRHPEYEEHSIFRRQAAG